MCVAASALDRWGSEGLERPSRHITPYMPIRLRVSKCVYMMCVYMLVWVGKCMLQCTSSQTLSTTMPKVHIPR